MYSSMTVIAVRNNKEINTNMNSPVKRVQDSQEGPHCMWLAIQSTAQPHSSCVVTMVYMAVNS
jgi:hypothetical protein